jgi:hypothetical protein
MIMPYQLIIVYPLLTLNTNETYNNFIPHQSYTTTYMIQHQDLKVYERFWNNLIKENDKSIIGP